MSFLKKLFDKRKDKKYGKGHKLGDAASAAAEQEHHYQQLQQQQYLQHQQQKRPLSVRTDAARRAGEAALARMHQKNAPPRPSGSSSTSTRQQVAHELTEQEHERQKAMRLKEHYFGAQKVIEASGVVQQSRIRFKADVLSSEESYPRGEVEERIEQALMEQYAQEPILSAVTLLFTANAKTGERLAKCVEILTKYADNIVNNPSEDKYRKIRVENPTFKEKCYALKYVDLVLKSAGFKAKQLANDDGAEEAYFVFGSDESLDKLNALKEALSLAEPIVPYLDRDIRVYYIGDSNTSSLAKFDLSDEFYNLKIDDIRREQKMREEALEKTGMLRTKAMRERDEQLELRKYSYCLIRVRFPNDFMLEALFRATETYHELCQTVASCLAYEFIEFELAGHSLRKERLSDTSTLAECGLAPGALLNFKWREESLREAEHNMKCRLSDVYLREDLMDRATQLQ